jgi:hypothetical protein
MCEAIKCDDNKKPKGMRLEVRAHTRIFELMADTVADCDAWVAEINRAREHAPKLNEDGSEIPAGKGDKFWKMTMEIPAGRDRGATWGDKRYLAPAADPEQGRDSGERFEGRGHAAPSRARRARRQGPVHERIRAVCDALACCAKGCQARRACGAAC